MIIILCYYFPIINNITSIKYQLKDLNEKIFVLYHHLGLGDHIVCNGLVNYVSTNNNKIYLPVNTLFKDQITYLYRDNKKIEIFPVNLGEVNNADSEVEKLAYEKNIPILKIGFENRLNKKIPFYKSFYKQIGLKYNISYKYFNPSSDEKKEEQLYNHLIKLFNIENNKYILIHDEASDTRYKLKTDTDLKAINLSNEFDIFDNIFLYKKIINDASEIHCINSSFAHLVDRFDTSGKLIYHNVRGGKLKFKKKWNYIDY
jgi:hypothetical protein